MKICVILLNDLRKDPMIRRQTLALKDRCTVSALGLEKRDIEGIDELILSDTRTFFRRDLI